MKVIQKKNIKYIKLCIISPLYEILTNLVYIVSFLILAAKYTDMGNNFSNYEISLMTEKYFEIERFSSITTDTDFISYLEMILNKLFTFDPSTDALPLLLPLDALRLTKYTNPPEDCSSQVDYSKTCINDFDCTVSTLKELYNEGKCGRPFSGNKQYNESDDAFSGMVSKFKGEYSKYDLFAGGFQLDLTIDEFNENRAFYEDFIKDRDLKFIVIQVNMHIPSNGNYVNVIAGVEMLNYFTHPFPIFSETVYSNYNPNDAFFITVFVFYSTAVILTIIKLLYEANVKFFFSIHIFCFFNEILNLLLLIFTCFFLSSSKNIEYTSTKEFHSHLPLICIRKYIILILAMIMICIPFRVISLLSWSKTLSKPFVKYISVIFRMIPGLLVCFFVFGMILYMFSLMNYALYNEVLYQYKDLYNSFLSLFDFQIINDLVNKSKIYHSLSHSSYYVVFNLFQLLCIILMLGFLTGTVCYLFKKSSELEEEKVENEVIAKLEQIEEKLKEGREVEDNDLRKLKKQILWLNLSSKNDVYNLYSASNELLLFKTAGQIISFLKYLFAIKPELQFKKLDSKFGIVIEIKNEKLFLQDTEFEHVELLIDWLLFVGCKIPVMVFCQLNLEKAIKMKLHSMYKNIRFTTDQSEVAKFIKDNSSENILCHIEKFSITMNNELSRNSSNIINVHSMNDKKKSSNNSFESELFK